MKELVLSGNGGKRMSSLEIAQLVESRHDSVKRTIERLSKSEVITLPPLVENPTNESGGRPGKTYLLDKRSSLIVVAQLSPQFTARVVDRWQELEAHVQEAPRFKLPDFTNPIIAARAWADEVEQKQLLQIKIEEQAPKVEFANQVEESINAIPIGNFAKYLHKHGLSIGQKRLFAFLRDRNILMGDNTPYQAHLNRGWFEVKELIISTAKGIFSRPKTLVTGKGQIALTNIVLAYYKNGNQKATYLPGLEVRA